MSQLDAAADAADIVSIAAIQLTAVVGLDLWGRTDTPQPFFLSLAFHLAPSSLLLAAATDNAQFSIRPWDVIRTVEAVVARHAPFVSGKAFFRTVIDSLEGTGACEQCRLRADMRRALGCLRAEEGVRWEAIWHASALRRIAWSAHHVLVPVTLGQTEHERSMKQHVALDVRFEEADGVSEDVPYALLLENVIQLVEASAFRSLERLVHEATRVAVLGSPHVRQATVSVKRLKAAVGADYTAVQMTRTRDAFTEVPSIL
ncbi:hypothetical protein K488DRAFT_85272 [Vararia minispora EC-137]|uniref:Uncharacterized protein n=1 Tax=Vararia minispora EC-137 TaxID=1314806 RepID=A0ACB8QMQ1_9AGAM|nr:hypothetical protein K488DRAFT_85272 [Vararia minispora EC-137]